MGNIKLKIKPLLFALIAFLGVIAVGVGVDILFGRGWTFIVCGTLAVAFGLFADDGERR